MGWDSNPRKVALHTLSKRADSAALAPILTSTQRSRPERAVEMSLADAIVNPPSVASAALGEVVVGSCATDACEPGQGRNAAAFSGSGRVPQIAWPLPH
jgi:hypothetical protein